MVCRFADTAAYATVVYNLKDAKMYRTFIPFVRDDRLGELGNTLAFAIRSGNVDHLIEAMGSAEQRSFDAAQRL